MYGGIQAGLLSFSVRASALLAQLKEIQYTGRTRFSGDDLIQRAISARTGTRLAEVDVAVNVIFVKVGADMPPSTVTVDPGRRPHRVTPPPPSESIETIVATEHQRHRQGPVRIRPLGSVGAHSN